MASIRKRKDNSSIKLVSTSGSCFRCSKALLRPGTKYKTYKITGETPFKDHSRNKIIHTHEGTALADMNDAAALLVLCHDLMAYDGNDDDYVGQHCVLHQKHGTVVHSYETTESQIGSFSTSKA